MIVFHRADLESIWGIKNLRVGVERRPTPGSLAGGRIIAICGEILRFGEIKSLRKVGNRETAFVVAKF